MTFRFLNLAWEFGIQDSQKSILQHCQQYSPDFYLHVSAVEAIKRKNSKDKLYLGSILIRSRQLFGFVPRLKWNPENW